MDKRVSFDLAFDGCRGRHISTVHAFAIELGPTATAGLGRIAFTNTKMLALQEPSAQSIGLAIGLVFALALLANGIYNRYFHPLRHVPGPFWASVTDFWKLYICMTKESHIRGLELHKVYGQ